MLPPGRFSVCTNPTAIGSAPANDHCAGSIAINSVPYTHSGSTCLATNDRTNCVGPSSNDVFYTLNLATCQTVTVSLCGSSYDTAIEVLTGGACPGSS